MELQPVFSYIITTLCYSILVFSWLPLIRLQYWLIRVFDYPRFQKFWINLVLIPLFLLIRDADKLHDNILIVLLAFNQFYLLVQIWPFIPLSRKQMKPAEVSSSHTVVKLFIANVFQDNTSFDTCRQCIKQYDPDIVLLLETDQKWCDALEPLKQVYRYCIAKPQSNTYGMLLFSRFTIDKYTIRYLVEPEVPSIQADIRTPDQRVFRLYGLHPKPPVPHESADSGERDAEILLVGKESKKCTLPVIVAGDLNDVAWSYTTRLFLKVSGLLDPRRGRGFFSTFHAQYRLLRWPLDHVFCSSHFMLQTLKRLPDIGSDHFPIFIQVALNGRKLEENQKEEKHADTSDVALADDLINRSR